MRLVATPASVAPPAFNRTTLPAAGVASMMQMPVQKHKVTGFPLGGNDDPGQPRIDAIIDP